MINIFLDLDGTILDIKEKYYFAHQQACYFVKLPPLDFHIYWRLKRKGCKEKDIFFKFYRDASLSIFKKYDKKRIFILETPEALRRDKLSVKIRQPLENLSCRFDLYLVTSRRTESRLRWQMNNLDIKKYFKKILCSPVEDDPVKSKLKTIKQQITPKDKDIIVGDTEVEILVGKSLNIRNVALYSGIRNRNFLLKFNPEYIFKNFYQFYRFIRS